MLANENDKLRAKLDQTTDSTKTTKPKKKTATTKAKSTTTKKAAPKKA